MTPSTTPLVDEYEGKFTLETEFGFEPFSLAELVRFIDGTQLDEGWGGGLALTFNNASADAQNREELLDFTTVSSDIYTRAGTTLRPGVRRVGQTSRKRSRRRWPSGQATSHKWRQVKGEISGRFIGIVKPPARIFATRH